MLVIITGNCVEQNSPDHCGSVCFIFTWGLLLFLCHFVLDHSLWICGACECQRTVTWNWKASFDSCCLTRATAGIHLPVAMLTGRFGHLRIVSQVAINTWHCHFSSRKDTHLTQSTSVHGAILLILRFSQCNSFQHFGAEQQNAWLIWNSHS